MNYFSLQIEAGNSHPGDVTKASCFGAFTVVLSWDK